MRIWLVKDGEHLPIQGDVRPMRMWLLANELVARGHEVVWWSSTFSHQQKELLADVDLTHEVRAGFTLEMIYAGSYSGNVSLQRVLHHRRLAKRFARRCRREKEPDLIVAAHPIPDLSYEAVRYARENNIPVVVDIRDIWPESIDGAISRLLRPLARIAFFPYHRMTRSTMKKATSIVACSNGFLAWGMNQGRRQDIQRHRTFYLGYPTPTGGGAASIPALDNAPEKFMSKTIFCFIGSFGYSYELSLVGEVARRLANERDDIHFLIAGKGEQDQQLRAAYESLPNLSFLGWLDRLQVQHLLQISHVGLIPCNSPAGAAINKIFEYMSHGLPVISSLTGEMAEMFDSQNVGLSYDAGDVDGLLEHVVNLSDDPELVSEMSENAKSSFTEFFASEKIYPAYCDHLEATVSQFVADKRPSHGSGSRP